MSNIHVGELTVVRPCNHPECSNNQAGTTIQIIGEDDDVVYVPLSQVEKLVSALREAKKK